MPRPLQDQVNQSPYDRVLQESIRGELRIVNAGVPRSQERLSNLLGVEYPHVVCHDGSTHSFKRSELEYLANIMDSDEQKALALPMLIELGSNQGEAAIVCQGGVEEKAISEVLDMPVKCEEGRITIYKPQLALLRRKLKTTTVYLFSPKIMI